MNEMNKIFGNRIRQLREEKGLYQEDIGDWVKVGKSTVSQWESGRLPHATVIAELAKKFDTSTDYLLGLTDLRKPYIMNHDSPEYQKTLDKINEDKKKGVSGDDENQDIPEELETALKEIFKEASKRMFEVVNKRSVPIPEDVQKEIKKERA